MNLTRFGGVVNGEIRVTIRTAPDQFEDARIEDASWRWLSHARQYRDFTYWKGQKNYPGMYWSATMRTHVGYESRLELWSALIADFEPQVQFQLSQPFELSQGEGKARRRHIPDYLLRYDDGGLCVVDVKPTAKLSDPEVRAQFEWTRRTAEARGWNYRVESEPDPTYLQNVRYLSGYRRSMQFDQDQVHLALRRLSTPVAFSQAVGLIAPICEGHQLVGNIDNYAVLLGLDEVEVAVIAGYAAQVRTLQEVLISTKSKLQVVRVKAATIDSYQGQEADICIVSLTRSNRRGDVGFLGSPERLNVAISRARDGLVIVGNRAMADGSSDRRRSRKLAEVARAIAAAGGRNGR